MASPPAGSTVYGPYKTRQKENSSELYLLKTNKSSPQRRSTAHRKRARKKSIEVEKSIRLKRSAICINIIGTIHMYTQHCMKYIFFNFDIKIIKKRRISPHSPNSTRFIGADDSINNVRK